MLRRSTPPHSAAPGPIGNQPPAPEAIYPPYHPPRDTQPAPHGPHGLPALPQIADLGAAPSAPPTACQWPRSIPACLKTPPKSACGQLRATATCRLSRRRWQTVLVDAADDGGVQAIHRAAEGGHLTALRWLVEQGACVNAADVGGLRPLHRAAAAPFDDPSDDDYYSDEVAPTCDDGTAAVLLLLQLGADAGAADNGGYAALHYAFPDEPMPHLDYDPLATVKALLHAGADPCAASDTGVTPLHSAAESTQLACVKLLLARGADAAATTDHGQAPHDLVSDAAPRFNVLDDIELETEMCEKALEISALLAGALLGTLRAERGAAATRRKIRRVSAPDSAQGADQTA